MSNTSRIVDKLVTKNLVRKVKSLDDSRSINVVPTEKGLALIDALTSIIGDYENNFLGLNPEDVETLNALLTKLKK
jgi:DNA-binding MarR family transcriptional regulator